jgi:hypothetical protein
VDLSAAILGRSVVSYLVDRQSAAVLRIGRDSFDRAALAGVACFNFTAAANLSKILNSELRVADTREVYEKIPPARLALPRLGAVSLAVLGAAFEARGIGGATPLENWYRKHEGGTVTFQTLKHRDAKRERPKKRRRPRR